MEDPRWVRLIAVGLVLAALAIVYFLLSGSFVKTKPKGEVSNKVVVEAPASPSPRPATESAYTRIVNRTQGGVQALPRTGFPIGLLGVFSISAIAVGLGLRKFPS